MVSYVCITILHFKGVGVYYKVCKRALMLGGLHLYQLFLLNTKDNTSVYRRAELAICDLMKNPIKMEFLWSIQVLFFDEAGQVSDEMFAVLDIISR